MNLLRKCAAEFIGAFAIVFAGCGAVAIDQISGGAVSHVGVAATFGLVIMVMIYATGHISGAHFNPAVTLAFALTRHFPKREIAPYILAQCAGAVVASYIHVASLSSVLAATQPGQVLNLGVTLPVDGLFTTALVWEFMLTFLLMLVIMSMATDFRAVGAGGRFGHWRYRGGLEAMFAGPLCGASMNPARSLGPALAAGEWTTFAAYIIGPVLGSCGWRAVLLRIHSLPSAFRPRSEGLLLKPIAVLEPHNIKSPAPLDGVQGFLF